MTSSPSKRELFGVWVAGSVGEIASFHTVENVGEVVTASDVAAMVLFLVTPLFLVAYSLIWAWPLALVGHRATIAALFAFGAAFEATAVRFSETPVDAVTNTALLMRFLAVLGPVLFAGYAVAAFWALRRWAGTPKDRRSVTSSASRWPPADGMSAIDSAGPRGPD